MDTWINETKATEQLTYWIFDTFKAVWAKNTMQIDLAVCEIWFIYILTTKLADNNHRKSSTQRLLKLNIQIGMIGLFKEHQK